MSNPAVNSQALATLEYEALAELLGRYAQTPFGAERVRHLTPITDVAQLRIEHQRVTEFVGYQKRDGHRLNGLPDPKLALLTLGIQDTNLEPTQILDFIKLIEMGLSLRLEFNEIQEDFPALQEVFRQLPDLRTLLGQLSNKILPNGDLDDSASAELRRIRREINQQRADIHRSLDSLMRRESNSVQDEIITIRNGRFVIPVRNDSRSKVPGVMHGVSSSGQTAFIEPLTTIDANNDLVRLHELEAAEITRILFNLTSQLRGELVRLHRLIDTLTEIDFISARARLSREYACVAPELREHGLFFIEEGRHLLLERNLRQLQQAGKSIVPITFQLEEGQKSVMIISGPNAGGKTVVLKTAGLIALMAQSGLHVPAKSAVLPVFGQILADIGDHQSIAANLSTFSAHMQNIASIADAIKAPISGAAASSRPTLILLDEVGTGTDPDEGAALGIAIVDYFKRQGSLVLASTHYNRLKMYAYNTEGVINASVEFDEQTLQPTYRLLTDMAGASSGVEIARRLRLPEVIVEEASRLMSTKEVDANQYLQRLKASFDQQNNLIETLEADRKSLAEKYATLELDFIKRERERNAEFEAELRQATEVFNRESKRLMDQLQDRFDRLKFEKEQQKQAAALKRQLSDQVWGHRTESQRAVTEKLKPVLNKAIKATTSAAKGPSVPGALEPVAISKALQEYAAEGSEPSEDRKAAPLELKVGASAKVAGMNQTGIIESIRGDQVEVRVGNMKMKLTRDRLTAVEPEKPVQKRVPAGLSKGIDVDLNEDSDVPRELNVIGSNVDDATARVDKFLDNASLSSLDTVRIVHGSGMGVLRRALSQFLTGHPHVERFHPAPQNEGGNGATIVELRR